MAVLPSETHSSSQQGLKDGGGLGGGDMEGRGERLTAGNQLPEFSSMFLQVNWTTNVKVFEACGHSVQIDI